MNRNPEILFIAEYIKNVLYFATVKEGKILKCNADTHYFCIDNELVYENYFSDFGPLNLSCVYKYCKILNEKLKKYSNQRKIVHYTSADPKKKSNSAFVLGCYGVLYMSLQPKDALRPLMAYGQSYRPFQDATHGNSAYTISLLDCLQAIMKAKQMGFFNFQDFNYEEYERLDKLQGGDLNWIVPGKFLAFIGPVDYSVSLHHPPEMYIDYFLENNVKIVIRLNKRLYDGKVFSDAGINHYDLFFPDGSCPPRNVFMKFLQISEEANCAIAVHCKAGLGRTGTLIGGYLIKHYRMTSHEAIGWMRICRPGSVIGHQQEWLEKLEEWLIKQGNLYRKRAYNNIDKFPYHEFGIYSILEKTSQQRPVMFERSASQLVSTQTYSYIQPQTSKLKEATSTTKKESIDQWRVRPNRMSSRDDTKGEVSIGQRSTLMPRWSGSGEPRPIKSFSKSSTRASQVECKLGNNIQQRSTVKSNDTTNKKLAYDNGPAVTTFRTSNGPVIRSVNDARKFLLKTSMYNGERERQLMSSMIVTPQSHLPSRQSNLTNGGQARPLPYLTPTAFSTAPRTSTLPQQRRRLGRSPSPQQSRVATEKTRATNTPPPSRDLSLVKGESKGALRAVLSRLKLTAPREKSIGTASLGASRDAPMPKRAPSVRSDERPLATQGDLLNSVKFERRLRNTLHADKINEKFSNFNSQDKPFDKNLNSRITVATRGSGQDVNHLIPRDKSYIIKKPNSRTNASLSERLSSPNSKDKPINKNMNSRTNMFSHGGPDFSSSNYRDKSPIKNGNPRTNMGTRGGTGGQDFSAKEKPRTASKNFFGPTRPTSPKGRRSPNF